ncbi:MAG: response regulator [bacterium]
MRPKTYKIKKPILFALLISFLIFFILVFTTVYVLQSNHVEKVAEMELETSRFLLRKQFNDKAQLYEAIFVSALYHPDLPEMWEKHDYRSLKRYLKNLFPELKEKYSITNLAFYKTPSQHIFSIPKKQSLMGEQHVIDQAFSGQSYGYGLEMGAAGNFVLQTALPVFHEHKLVGVFSISAEISVINDTIKDYLNVDLIFLVNKRKVNKQAWQKEIDLYARLTNWDRYKDYVIVDNTITNIPDAIDDDYLQRSIDEKLLKEFSRGSNDYFVLTIPLQLADGEVVGKLLIIENISSEMRLSSRLLMVIFIICILLGLVMMIFFYKYITNIENQLNHYFLESFEESKEREKYEQKNINMQKQLMQSSRLASLGSLASGMAHELNNPLTVVMGYSKDLKNKELETGITKKRGKQIHEAAQKMKNIIAHLKNFAPETFKEEWTKVDVNKSLQNTLLVIQSKMDLKQITVHTEFHSDLPYILGDKLQLENAFYNILINSMNTLESVKKQTEKLVIVATSLDAGDNFVNIVIQDNAQGVLKEKLLYIFDPFYTSKLNSSVGLGPSVAKNIIEAHQGSINLVSDVKDGTTVIIRLPGFLPHEEEKIEDVPKRPSKAVDEKKYQSDKPKLLIIDDEPDIAEILGNMVGDHFNPQIVVPSEDLKDVLKNEKYEMIITDIKMDTLTGWDVLELVKLHHPETKVVMMSGYMQQEEDVENSLQRGAVGFIEKPFEDPQIIISKLKEWLGS